MYRKLCPEHYDLFRACVDSTLSQAIQLLHLFYIYQHVNLVMIEPRYEPRYLAICSLKLRMVIISNFVSFTTIKKMLDIDNLKGGDDDLS